MCGRVGTRRGIVVSFVVGVLVAGALDAAAFMAPAFVDGQPVTAQCVHHVVLTPHSEFSLVRHRQWIETPPGFASSNLSLWSLYPSYVVDARTQLAYDWSGVPDRGSGKLRFEVLTRWALLHPGWDQHDWLLLYDCSPSSGWPFSP
jgi:hypothetical protein